MQINKLKITSGITIDYTPDGWSEFKKWIDGTYAKLKYAWADEGESYSIAAIDSIVYRIFFINKSDAADFELNYKNYNTITSLSESGEPIINTILNDGYGSPVIIDSDKLLVDASGSTLTINDTTPININADGSNITSLAPIARTHEFVIETKTETTISQVTYTVTNGKDFYLSYFGGAAFAPLSCIVRLKVNGVTKFMVLSWHTQNNGIPLPMATKIATGGQQITVTVESQIPRGNAWVGFTGIEVDV